MDLSNFGMEDSIVDIREDSIVNIRSDRFGENFKWSSQK